MALNREQRAEYQRAYREKNKARLKSKKKEAARLHYLANKEKYKSKNIRWRQENPERYKELTKRHRELHREKAIATSRSWYAANKEKASTTNRIKKLRGYGLTEESFSQILNAQNRLCLLCRRPMKTPAVDHDHKTGLVRGILCRQCNAALGLFKDDLAVVERAASYLRSSSGANSTTNSAKPNP